MSISRSEIKFQPNVPVEVVLDRADGKEYASKFENAEPRYYFTCNGNTAFMYLPQAARNKLVRTGAQAGDTVRILKSVAGQSTTWNVEVLSDAQEPEPAPKPPASAPGPRAVPAVRTNGATALQPAARQIPQSYPIIDRYVRMFAAAAESLKATHQQLTADPFFRDLEAPTWEDIRALAIHWGIGNEKKGGAR